MHSQGTHDEKQTQQRFYYKFYYSKKCNTTESHFSSAAFEWSGQYFFKTNCNAMYVKKLHFGFFIFNIGPIGAEISRFNLINDYSGSNYIFT